MREVAAQSHMSRVPPGVRTSEWEERKKHGEERSEGSAIREGKRGCGCDPTERRVRGAGLPGRGGAAEGAPLRGERCPDECGPRSLRGRAPASGAPASTAVRAPCASASPDLAVRLIRGVLQGKQPLSLLQTMPTFGPSDLSRPRRTKERGWIKSLAADRCLPLYL